MPKQITKYKCNHCKKSWMSKSRATQHEIECYRNPENKSCSTCYSNESDRNGYWCGVFQKEIFIKGSPILNCPMHKNIYDYENEEV